MEIDGSAVVDDVLQVLVDPGGLYESDAGSDVIVPRRQQQQ